MTFTKSIELPDTVNSFLEKKNLSFEYGITKFQNDITELKTFISGFCNNTDLAIGKEYFDDVFREVESNANFKIIFVLYDDKTIYKKDLHKIVGFMITQTGECTKEEYKNIPALNLICINKKESVAKLPTAKSLLFLYTYTLKTDGFNYGLLELSYNYKNISGLKSYSKFGFRETLSLKLHCFNHFLTKVGDIRSMKDKKKNILTEDATLPMTVDLIHIPIDKLESALIENVYIEEHILNQLDPLCSQEQPVTSFQIKKRQKLLIQIINIKRLSKELQRENKVQNGLSNDDSLDLLFDKLGRFAQDDTPIIFVQYSSPRITRYRSCKNSITQRKRKVAVESTTQRKRKVAVESTTQRKRKVISPVSL